MEPQPDQSLEPPQEQPSEPPQEQPQGLQKKTVSRRAVVIQFAIVFGIFFSLWLALVLLMQNKSVINGLALMPTVGSDAFPGKLPGIASPESIDVPASDGSKLHAWLFIVPGASKIALVNHGNAGNNANRLYLASVLTKAHVNVLLYDYRGYGTSTGKATLQGILEDGDMMYQFVRGKYSGQQIILYGESIGTAVSCHVAAGHECAGVILQSAIKSLPAAGKFVFPILQVFPEFVFPQPRLDNLALIGKINCPVLLMHGLKDRITSSSNSQQLFDAAKEPKTLVFLPGCGHNDMGVQDTELFDGSIAKFIGGLK